MTKYGVQYRDADGIVKHRNFKYEKDFYQFMEKLYNKEGVEILSQVIDFKLIES